MNPEPQSFSSSALEPHYSVQVLAELWRLDESTIRRMFEDVAGVFKIGTERRRNGKRDYFYAPDSGLNCFTGISKARCG